LDSRRDDEARRETKEILAEAGTMAVLAEGLGELEWGEIVSLTDLRRELDAARSSFARDGAPRLRRPSAALRGPLSNLEHKKHAKNACFLYS
jgi:hypothetical protein